MWNVLVPPCTYDWNRSRALLGGIRVDMNLAFKKHWTELESGSRKIEESESRKIEE